MTSALTFYTDPSEVAFDIYVLTHSVKRLCSLVNSHCFILLKVGTELSSSDFYHWPFDLDPWSTQLLC